VTCVLESVEKHSTYIFYFLLKISQYTDFFLENRRIYYNYLKIMKKANKGLVYLYEKIVGIKVFHVSKKKLFYFKIAKMLYKK
jgi:hypothetical protein